MSEEAATTTPPAATEEAAAPAAEAPAAPAPAVEAPKQEESTAEFAPVVRTTSYTVLSFFYVLCCVVLLNHIIQ